MRSRELLVITDKPGCTGVPDAVFGLAVRTIEWQDVNQLKSVGDEVLLIDLDLRDVSKIKLIRDNLPDRRPNRCMIIAVDRASRHADAQACALGATDLLKRPFAMCDLTQVLRRHFGLISASKQSAEQSALKRAAGGQSIASAADALEELFSALTDRTTLQLNAVVNAGDQVVDAVADVGIRQWLETVRTYHEGTFQHCLLVTGVVTAFGHTHGMRRSDLKILTLAGLLHDIGKVEIPIQILDKPGGLTTEELAIVQAHPAVGHEYLLTQNTVSPDLLDVVRHHHEYLDGSGYPDELAGGEIKDLTRILTVCDVYGALVERRAYHAPHSPVEAIEMLSKMARDGKVEGALVKALSRVVLDQ